MKNMCTILMHINPIYVLTVNITCYMISFVNYKTFFPCFCHFACKNSSKKTCSNN